jgi:uncharacterized membrane protein YesL
MKLSGLTGGIYFLSIWISRLAILNLLWITFTIAGLVLLGFFPATVAMFTLIRKWIFTKEDPPLFRTFWSVFRTEFIKANKFGLIPVVIGAFIYVDFKVLTLYDHWIFTLIHVVLIGVMILYFLSITFLFPVYVHYEAGNFENLKNSFILAVIKPLTSISVLLCSLIIIYVTIMFPALAVFFTGSVISLISISMTNREMRKLHKAKDGE